MYGKVSASNTIKIPKNKKLIIKSGASIDYVGEAVAGKNLICLQNQGNLILDGGTITNNVQSSGEKSMSITVFNTGGTLKVNSGSITNNSGINDIDHCVAIYVTGGNVYDDNNVINKDTIVTPSGLIDSSDDYSDMELPRGSTNRFISGRMGRSGIGNNSGVANRVENQPVSETPVASETSEDSTASELDTQDTAMPPETEDLPVVEESQKAPEDVPEAEVQDSTGEIAEETAGDDTSLEKSEPEENLEPTRDGENV